MDWLPTWVAAAGKNTLTTEVQVLRIGDCFLVGLPSEVFVEYQIEIRERSGAEFTFVSELANDSISYVPTPKAYEEGGYEVRSSSLAPEAGKALVDAAIELVGSLRYRSQQLGLAVREVGVLVETAPRPCAASFVSFYFTLVLV